MYDVITVGSATIDHFLTTEKKFSQVKLGDKVLVSHMETHTGGGATNTAAALAKLGLKVKALMKVGDDGHGLLIKHELHKTYGVKVIRTRPSKKPTDFSAIVEARKDKDRIIYAFKGASDDLRWRDFDKKDLDAKWIYMATLMHDAWPTAIKIARYAKKNGINLLFNPSKYLASTGAAHLKPILRATTLLVLNKEEAKSVVKSKSNDVRKLANQILKLGPKMVAITLGSKGVCLSDGNIFIDKRALKTKVVHTAGAGDAFTSGLLAGIVKGLPLNKALHIGRANAASVVRSIGTKNGLLTWKKAVKYRG